MAQGDSRSQASAKKGRDAATLRADQGECVVLSPESDRFKDHYRRVQPRTPEEARELVGLSDEMAEALREAGACCHEREQLGGYPDPRDLDSDDELERGRAFDTASRGFYSFLVTANPELLTPAKPAITRYLELVKPELNLVALQDIEVADGATLTISEDTHLVAANKIVMHGSGRIVCKGFTKLNVTSMERK